jgi:hypothetical protein
LHAVRQLRARLDVELAEHLAQVVLDRKADESTAFWVMESIRLDLGCGSRVHP